MSNDARSVNFAGEFCDLLAVRVGQVAVIHHEPEQEVGVEEDGEAEGDQGQQDPDDGVTNDAGERELAFDARAFQGVLHVL